MHVCVCVRRGGVLSKTFITVVDWVVVGGSDKNAHKERKSLCFYLVISGVYGKCMDFQRYQSARYATQKAIKRKYYKKNCSI